MDRTYDFIKTLMIPDVPVPPLTEVDIATYRRLTAMLCRMQESDTPDDDPTTMDEVIWCAIQGGLRESERDAGVERDHITGLPVQLVKPRKRRRFWRWF
jgi:hypothetical protein